MLRLKKLAEIHMEKYTYKITIELKFELLFTINQYASVKLVVLH